MYASAALSHLRNLTSSGYAQLRDALREYRVDPRPLVMSLAEMASATPACRQSDLALWLIREIATFRPDVFLQCLGDSFMGVTVAPDAVGWMQVALAKCYGRKTAAMQMCVAAGIEMLRSRREVQYRYVERMSKGG